MFRMLPSRFSRVFLTNASADSMRTLKGTRSILRRVSAFNIFAQITEALTQLSDKTAIDKLSEGDAVIIFTPDSKSPPRSRVLAFTHTSSKVPTTQSRFTPSSAVSTFLSPSLQCSCSSTTVSSSPPQRRRVLYALLNTTNGWSQIRLVCLPRNSTSLARFDPVYSDARAKAAILGEFNFFSAWMSQPKSQLETFRAWAGKDSDIRCVPTWSYSV